MAFLRISTSLHVRLTAVTLPADGEFLQGPVNRGGVSEITRKTSNIQKKRATRL
jgi:hypothetical protein